MLITFKIVLMVLMLFSATGIPGERDNKQLRDSMLTVFIASTAALIVVFMWL